MQRFRFWINLIHGWFVFSLINAVIFYVWDLKGQSEAPLIDRLLDVFGAFLLLTIPGFIFYAILNRIHLMFPITYDQKKTMMMNILGFFLLMISGLYLGGWIFDRPIVWELISAVSISTVFFFLIPYFRNSLFNYQ